MELFRKWNGDPAYLHLLRFIRLSSTDPSNPSIIQYGLQEQEKMKKTGKRENEPEGMEVDTTPPTTSATPTISLPGFPDVPTSRFSSTIMPMDC